MTLIFDPNLNIAYVRLRSKRQKVTTVAVSDELKVDLGPDGKVCGIELLNANQKLGLKKAKKLSVENRASRKTSSLAIEG